MATESDPEEMPAAPLPGWMRPLGHGLDAMAAIGTIWIAGIMALIVADVVGRNFFASPVTGVAEIAARSVVAIVFLMLPSAALRGTLIRADFLTRLIRHRSPGALRIIEIAFDLVAAGMFALMAWAAWPDTLSAWRTSEFFGVRGVWTLPTLPFRAIIVIGAGATALAFLATAARLILQPPRPTTPSPSQSQRSA